MCELISNYCNCVFYLFLLTITLKERIMNISISILIFILTIAQITVVFLTYLFKNNFFKILADDFFVFICLIGGLNGVIHMLLIFFKYLKFPHIQTGLITNQAYFSLALSLITLIVFAIKGFKWS